jgi:hypothetical protein
MIFCSIRKWVKVKEVYLWNHFVGFLMWLMKLPKQKPWMLVQICSWPFSRECVVDAVQVILDLQRWFVPWRLFVRWKFITRIWYPHYFTRKSCRLVCDFQKNPSLFFIHVFSSKQALTVLLGYDTYCCKWNCIILFIFSVQCKNGACSQTYSFPYLLWLINMSYNHFHLIGSPVGHW